MKRNVSFPLGRSSALAEIPRRWKAAFDLGLPVRLEATPFQNFYLLIAAALLLWPLPAFAQHGGGGHGAPGTGSGLSSSGRPDGVEDKDELKDFHRAMEVQATSDQAAAFRKILKSTEAAHAQLAERAKEGGEKRQAVADVMASLETVRTETNNFLEALSARQKSGLKEITGKVEKSEAELAGQEKTLGRGEGPAEAGRMENLAKALENFRSEQERLALEMGIVLSDAGEAPFTVPALKTSAEIGRQKIAVSASTTITRVGGGNGENVYKVEVAEDLADLQSNFTDVLRVQVNATPRCGERVELRDATVDVAAPESVAEAQIYVERWACIGLSTNLLAQGSGRVEVKVTPVVDANGEIEMKTELGRVEGDKFVTALVRSGALGDTLREKIAGSLAKAMESAGLRATLPPAGTAAAKAQSARFESTAAGNLGLIVNGEMKMGDEQAAALGKQLQERMTAGR
ncbi:MAG: hypothetical protein WBS24_18995 [Terriglobales bacterium]